MTKYIAKSPVSNYNGVSAGVQFKDGVGVTHDDYIASWLRVKGYDVKKDAPKKKKSE